MIKFYLTHYIPNISISMGKIIMRYITYFLYFFLSLWNLVYTLHLAKYLDQSRFTCSMATWGQWLPHSPVLENLLGSMGLRNNVCFSDPSEWLRANRVEDKRGAAGGTSENVAQNRPWEEGAVVGNSGGKRTLSNVASITIIITICS